MIFQEFLDEGRDNKNKAQFEVRKIVNRMMEDIEDGD